MTKCFEKIEQGQGFIAALDQSGGSTPGCAQGLWHRRGRLLERRGDVRPDPPDAQPDHHRAVLRQRQGDRRDPVRADDGRRGRRQAGARAAVGARRGAVPQGRQGPGRRSRRRPADEAESRARRAARPRQCQGRLRHQDALGDQARQSGGHRRGRGAAVRRGQAHPRQGPDADHRAGSVDQEPGARCRRRHHAGRNPEAARRAARRRAGHAEADHSRPKPACSSRWSITPRCCASSRFRAASAARKPAASWPGTPA